MAHVHLLKDLLRILIVHGLSVQTPFSNGVIHLAQANLIADGFICCRSDDIEASRHYYNAAVLRKGKFCPGSQIPDPAAGQATWWPESPSEAPLRMPNLCGVPRHAA